MQISPSALKKIKWYGSEFCFGIACEAGAGNVSISDVIDFVHSVLHHVLPFVC